jgi:hypothetical protein
MIHPKIERGFAGLQVGMFGGIAMLATLALVSMLDRRAWWSYPNVLGAYFYGARSIGGGPGWPTVAGIALQLLIAGCGGALFGAILGGLGGSRRVALMGLVWGVLVFYGCEQLYRSNSPIVDAYMPRSASLVAHMIYGVCLAGIGRIGGVTSPETQSAGDVSGRGTPVATPAFEETRLTSSSVLSQPEVASRETQSEKAVFGEPAKENGDSRG